MMPTLGFNPERDNDRLVASFSGGWQMRIGLGKILLQEPDLLLLVRAPRRAAFLLATGLNRGACFLASSLSLRGTA